MHLLMATIDALGISTDNLVLNRTTLQKIREQNRHDQFDEAKSDTIDKVIHYNYIFLFLRYDFKFIIFFTISSYE